MEQRIAPINAWTLSLFREKVAYKQKLRTFKVVDRRQLWRDNNVSNRRNLGSRANPAHEPPIYAAYPQPMPGIGLGCFCSGRIAYGTQCNARP